MPELPELPEVHHLHHHSHGDPFGRTIAIITVLTTLAATVVAVLQAQALSDRSHASALAQTMAIESLGTRVADEGSARVQVSRFQMAEQQRGRAGLARQELLFAPPEDREELRTVAERWETIADETDRESEAIAAQDHVEVLTADGELGPTEDPTFPLGYLAHSREHTYELEAERQVENRIAAAAEDQFAGYAVSFTMLAIATFLFGYSLTPHGRPRRRLFAGAGATFVAIALTNATLVYFEYPPHPSHESAVAYAEGQIAADSLHPEEAVEHFTKAIELDPDFAGAYVARADAEFLAHSPLALSGGSSVTTAEALEKVIADERKARELGVRDPLFNSALGSDLLALGLDRQDDEHLEEAVGFLKEALKSSKTDPSPAYDLGAALVALGRDDEAAKAYDVAIERTAYVKDKDGNKELRRDPLSEEEDLAVGLEGLQNVGDHGPRSIAPRIASLKQRLITELAAAVVKAENEPEEAAHGAEDEGHGEETPDSGSHAPGAPSDADEAEAESETAEQAEEEPTTGKEPSAEEEHAEEPNAAEPETAGEDAATKPAPQLKGVDIDLAPEATRFVIPAQEGFDPEHDRLSVQWYYEDPNKLGWSVITEASSISQPPLPEGANPDYQERFPYLGLTTPATCLPSGTYRLELYVNTALAAVVTEAYDNPLEAAELRGLDVGLCRPPDWEHAEGRQHGLLDGFTSPEGDAGSLVFSLTPSLIGTGATPSPARMREVLDRVLERFGNLLPAAPVESGSGPQLTSLETSLVRRYRVGDGQMFAGIGQSRNGQLLVNVIYGPPDFFSSGEAARIFTSLADRA